MVIKELQDACAADRGLREEVVLRDADDSAGYL